MSNTVVMGNGIKIDVEPVLRSVVVDDDSGITKTSAKPLAMVTSAVKSAATSLSSNELGELIGRLSLEIAEGVQAVTSAQAWEHEYKISFGVTIGGEAGVKVASCTAEGSFEVSVKFMSQTTSNG
jgi:hypothetical protein